MNAAELCQDFQQIMLHEGPQADASNRSLVPFILFRGHFLEDVIFFCHLEHIGPKL